jgi:hypothetical protein
MTVSNMIRFYYQQQKWYRGAMRDIYLSYHAYEEISDWEDKHRSRWF